MNEELKKKRDVQAIEHSNSEGDNGNAALSYRQGFNAAIQAVTEMLGEFQNPDIDGSEFQNFIVNGSTPHGNRDESAWHYSLGDATRGARWQHSEMMKKLRGGE